MAPLNRKRATPTAVLLWRSSTLRIAILPTCAEPKPWSKPSKYIQRERGHPPSTIQRAQSVYLPDPDRAMLVYRYTRTVRTGCVNVGGSLMVFTVTVVEFSEMHF